MAQLVSHYWNVIDETLLNGILSANFKLLGNCKDCSTCQSYSTSQVVQNTTQLFKAACFSYFSATVSLLQKLRGS